MRTREPHPVVQRGGRGRTHRRVLEGLGVVLALVLARPVAPAAAAALRVYHIDVDQGDATLFVSPGDRTLLVDSGRNGHGARIKALMDQAGVSRIDNFVNTHYHDDHYGGVDELIRELGVTIAAAFDRGDKEFLPDSKREGERFRDYEGSIGHQAVHLQRGEGVPFDPEVSVVCIASGGAVLGEEQPTVGRDENDMSVSLLVQYGSFRYFIGGDIEEATERKIAQRDLVLDVDVYHADHHGSDTSSAREFMEDLRPTVIITSNGNRSDYQHPRQSTLDSFAALNPPPTVFQTNKYLKGGIGGNVPDDRIADLESSEADGTILLSVDLGIGSYTVAYRDQARQFAIKGGPAVTDTVVIDRLLPDPAGEDQLLETVTLRNKGSVEVPMAGWRLQDASGRIWPLVGIGAIPSGQSRTVVRNGMAMSLNNEGDEVVLFDGENNPRDRFAYAAAQEGAVVHTGH